jgi:hypothetical protein
MRIIGLNQSYDTSGEENQQGTHHRRSSKSKSRASSIERSRLNHEAYTPNADVREGGSISGGSSRHSNSPLLPQSPAGPNDGEKKSVGPSSGKNRHSGVVSSAPKSKAPKSKVVVSIMDLNRSIRITRNLVEHIKDPVRRARLQTAMRVICAAVDVLQDADTSYEQEEQEEQEGQEGQEEQEQQEEQGNTRNSLEKVYSILYSLTSKALHFTGSNDTSVIVILGVTAATAIITGFAVAQPRTGECAPQSGDSDFWAAISQAIVSLCSSYYLLVPYLRGSKWPVRAWFYMLWLVAAGTAVTAPVLYVRNWKWSLWFVFGSAIAQCASTALLFEKLEGTRKERVKAAKEERKAREQK